jgi:hypothetical protein
METVNPGRRQDPRAPNLDSGFLTGCAPFAEVRAD